MGTVEQNVGVVQGLYAAFGRGDVPTILGALRDDVVWELDAADHGIALLRPGVGREHAMSFFAQLAGLSFDQFEVVGVMGTGDWVTALIRLDVRVNATGKRHRDLEVHLWRLDAEGRVTAFRHFVDTIAFREALAG